MGRISLTKSMVFSGLKGFPRAQTPEIAAEMMRHARSGVVVIQENNLLRLISILATFCIANRVNSHPMRYRRTSHPVPGGRDQRYREHLFPLSSQEFLNDPAMDIGQSEITATVTGGQFCVVNP
jgi:hypothetical protein